MKSKEDPGQPQPDPNLSITLSPIATHGQDALATCGIKAIEGIKLTKVQVLEHNAHCPRTTKEAEDLFALMTADPERPSLVPQHATLTQTGMTFKIAGVPDPVQVELLPPNTIRISNAAMAPLILDWFTRSLFNAASTLGHLALVLALAIATATAPAFDDNDGDADDDDGDSERHHPRFTLRPYEQLSKTFAMVRA